MLLDVRSVDSINIGNVGRGHIRSHLAGNPRLRIFLTGRLNLVFINFISQRFPCSIEGFQNLVVLLDDMPDILRINVLVEFFFSFLQKNIELLLTVVASWRPATTRKTLENESPLDMFWKLELVKGLVLIVDPFCEIPLWVFGSEIKELLNDAEESFLFVQSAS